MLTRPTLAPMPDRDRSSCRLVLSKPRDGSSDGSSIKPPELRVFRGSNPPGAPFPRVGPHGVTRNLRSHRSASLEMAAPSASSCIKKTTLSGQIQVRQVRNGRQPSLAWSLQAHEHIHLLWRDHNEVTPSVCGRIPASSYSEYLNVT